MRHALRNRAKIKSKLGSDALKCIDNALCGFFNDLPRIEHRYINNLPVDRKTGYKVLFIETEKAEMCFYVLAVKFDVVRLALKTFEKRR